MTALLAYQSNYSIPVLSRLTRDALMGLIEGRHQALIIPKYLDAASAAQAVTRLNRESYVDYTYEVADGAGRKSVKFGVSRFGTPFATTFGKDMNAPEWQRYFDDAPAFMAKIRSAFGGVSPIDRFRLDLDEIWPEGASIGKVNGRQMFAGIVRRTEAGYDMLEKKPHVDSVPPGLSFLDMEVQLSANVYLTVPEKGGELEVWKAPFFSKEEVHSMTANERLWDGSLGRGALIKPRVGDLVLISTQRPHAVRKFDEGSRLSIQTFFGYRPGESLKIWC